MQTYYHHHKRLFKCPIPMELMEVYQVKIFAQIKSSFSKRASGHDKKHFLEKQSK